VVKNLTIVHLSDLHFGGVADLAQIEELERLVPTLEPDVITFSGDLTQRSRHGEFQRARALVRRFQETAPTLVVPGNHDVTWWRTGLRSTSAVSVRSTRSIASTSVRT
jgi:3',5'-cyclic AMP phosphodiesterase CpdA